LMLQHGLPIVRHGVMSLLNLAFRKL